MGGCVIRPLLIHVSTLCEVGHVCFNLLCPSGNFVRNSISWHVVCWHHPYEWLHELGREWGEGSCWNIRLPQELTPSSLMSVVREVDSHLDAKLNSVPKASDCLEPRVKV